MNATGRVNRPRISSPPKISSMAPAAPISDISSTFSNIGTGGNLNSFVMPYWNSNSPTMMRKMLSTTGSKRASMRLNWSMVAPLSLLHRGIDAPRAAAGCRQVKEREAVQRGQRAAVDQRMKALREMRDEIGKRHLAGQDECHR